MDWLNIGRQAMRVLGKNPEYAGIAAKFIAAALPQISENDEVRDAISQNSQEVLVGAAECDMGLVFHLRWIWLAVQKAKTPEGRQWLRDVHTEHGAPFPGDSS